MALSHVALRIASQPRVVRFVERVARGGAVSQGDERRPVMAFTFDDGPHPEFTPRLLDRLDELGAPATFFVVGRNVERYPSIVREARERGHDIGIHLYSHERRTAYDHVRFDIEVRRCQAQLESVLGEPARFLRFPYGDRGHQDPDRVLRNYGLRCVHWTFSSLDSTARTPERIVGRVDAGLRAGAIVLFHDALADEGGTLGWKYRPERDATIAALPEVLSRARARGLSPVTLGNLLPRPTSAPS